ncbi:MAG: PAS domain S-box protein [Thermoanaerobaculales bacterium]|nr:PAS domain S-box protein [Thermoanaerobaculales bacterium]
MVTEIDNPEHDGPSGTCPVTGLPVVRRPEWTNVEADSGYLVTVEVIGGRILRSRPRGFATGTGVERVNELHRRAAASAIVPGGPYVHIADYSAFKGASAEARRLFADDLREREGLAAVIFHDASPFFSLAIRLGRHLYRLHMPVEIAVDEAGALRRAIEILEEEGIGGLPEIGGAPQSPPPETGTLELDHYRVSYQIVDGHIVHGRSFGLLGVKEMERHLELESMVLMSIDARKGDPVFVVDLSGLDGVTAAARRLYVASLRSRQRIHPVALYVCYGVNQVIRNAINISRPFLPFRIRVARDEATALDIARRETTKSERTVARIRSIVFPTADAVHQPQADHIDDLLRLMSNVEWDREGGVAVEWQQPPDHPLSPVIDALELIKAEVDEQFRRRRATEEALRASEERYRNILDSIVDGFYEIDFDGRLLAFNGPLLKIFGFNRADIATVDPLSLLNPDDVQAVVDTFRRVHETGEPVRTSDWEMRRRDGGTVNVQTSISLVRDPDGRPVGFRGIVRDITERVRTAREKADLEAQLQRSQRMEAIGTLAGGIAHNFNNLLMGIQGNISLLARELPPDGPQVRRLATVEALVTGGSRLTAQLLGYARAGRVEVRVVDLNRSILETAETFALTRREYRVHIDLEEGTLPVRVDPAQLEQALLNLLINAADSMPHGGDITVSSRLVQHTDLAAVDTEPRIGPHALVTVRDTGCGMDRDTIEHIFEPFFTTKGMTGGTGLGLASTYGIIKAHGGQIDVESSPGEGSTFRFSFPAEAEAPPEAPGALRPPPVEGQGTILVVEDDQAVLEACAAMLKMLRYTPICVGSGAAAVDIFELRRDEIDLVILDLVLTDLSGSEVFDRIRAVDPDARVLLASGYSLDGEAAGLLARGCDDFIQKPFTMEQLSLKIEDLLNRSP